MKIIQSRNKREGKYAGKVAKAKGEKKVDCRTRSSVLRLKARAKFGCLFSDPVAKEMVMLIDRVFVNMVRCFKEAAKKVQEHWRRIQMPPVEMVKEEV